MKFAIIGLACRFPGSSNNPEQFFQNLLESKDCVNTVPKDRWDTESFYNKDNNVPNSINNKRGGFMDHLYEFDYQTFSMSKKESENIDPQQKILLEGSNFLL